MKKSTIGVKVFHDDQVNDSSAEHTDSSYYTESDESLAFLLGLSLFNSVKSVLSINGAAVAFAYAIESGCEYFDDEDPLMGAFINAAMALATKTTDERHARLEKLKAKNPT